MARHGRADRRWPSGRRRPAAGRHRAARPPRQVLRKLNIGATVGRPHDVETQRETLRKLVSLIENAEGPGAVDPAS